MRKIAGNVPAIVYCSAVGDAVRQSRCGFSDDLGGFNEDVMSVPKPAMTAVITRKRETNEFLTNLEFSEGQWLEALTGHFHPV